MGCDLDAAENARTVDAVQAAGGDMTGMAPVDLGDSRDARQWVADAAAVHGRIDVLFNNAAAPRFAPGSRARQSAQAPVPARGDKE